MTQHLNQHERPEIFNWDVVLSGNKAAKAFEEFMVTLTMEHANVSREEAVRRRKAWAQEHREIKLQQSLSETWP